MKEDWTDKLRRKLEGHEMPPPEGLWEGISEQMDNPFGFKPISRLTGTAQRWWAAAAVVLALVGCFVAYEMSDSEQPLLQADAVPQHQTQQQPANLPSNEQFLPDQPSAQHQTIAMHEDQGDRSLDSEAQAESRTCPPDLPMSLEKEQPAEVELLLSEVEQHEDQPIEHEQKPASKTPANPVILDIPEITDTYEASAPQKKKWSVGINASGGLLAANTSQRMDRVYYKSAAFNSSEGYNNYAEIASSPYSLTKYESKHHLPLRFGLSLQYQLNERLSLLSGINYTYLYSEFSIPLYQSASYDQKLHYLGLPIGLSWQLLRASRFHLYLAGGVMMEKCLNEKPWQWSVNGSTGAEYAIIPQLGVYLEPSLGYYFSDGTQFEHYYKEHPLAPSIEFGLRLHVGE